MTGMGLLGRGSGLGLVGRGGRAGKWPESGTVMAGREIQMGLVVPRGVGSHAGAGAGMEVIGTRHVVELVESGLAGGALGGRVVVG